MVLENLYNLTTYSDSYSYVRKYHSEVGWEGVETTSNVENAWFNNYCTYYKTHFPPL